MQSGGMSRQCLPEAGPGPKGAREDRRHPVAVAEFQEAGGMAQAIAARRLTVKIGQIGVAFDVLCLGIDGIGHPGGPAGKG
jgi:hypothetical protein